MMYGPIYFALWYLLLITIPLFIGCVWYRVRYYQSVSYTYPLTSWLQKVLFAKKDLSKKILFLLRAVSLAMLAILIGKPQLVDRTSKIDGQGVDIIMVLDVSGSMRLFDDINNRQSRLESAKKEALRFVEKRPDDPIGVVLFGAAAVSRVPLTLDKKILKEVIADLYVGIIPDEGTVLAKGMLVGAARLKNSKSKNKIMILLTDGEPSPDDQPIGNALAVVKKLGIKVYTIGVGSSVAYLDHPQVGIVPVDSRLNTELLSVIAQETGGRFFEARNPDDLRAIYDQIDRLEKTKYETTIFSNYYDIFIPFVWIIVLLLLLELILTSTIWFVL
jgi:Ca-activated chloride channel family protein